MPDTTRAQATEAGQAWVSSPAVAWALDDAPDVPPTLVATLVAVARHAGPDGRGARPGIPRVAKATRKSERQAQRDIRKLVDLGLLVLGDQSLVAHLSPDRRPVVYDIPIHKRGDTHVTPEPERGDTHDTSRGDMGVRAGCHPGQNGVTPVSPEEEEKNPDEQSFLQSLSPRRPPAAGQRERDGKTTDADRIVEAYVQGSLDAGLGHPSGRQVDRVRRDAAQLLVEGHRGVDELVTAARELGEGGWFDLERHLIARRRPVQASAPRHVAFQASKNDDDY